MTIEWGPDGFPTREATSQDGSDVADTGLPNVELPSNPQFISFPVGRPQLQRNQPQPPPSHQPPPPPSSHQVGNPQDSLSLMQLRRIVTEFPRVEPIAYAFTYADTASYEEELEEWFSYDDVDFARLRNARDTFERRWKKSETRSWVECDIDTKKTFIQSEITGLQAADIRRRCKSLQTLWHIVLGVWHETADCSIPTADGSETAAEDAIKSKTTASKSQMEAIKGGVMLLTECGGIPQIYQLMQRAFDRL